MLLVSIFIVLTAISAILYYLRFKNNEVMMGIALAFALVTACMTAPLVGIEKRQECFVHRYENQQALISKGAVTYLAYEDCKAMNNKIARNKAYCNSPWVGIWFSEEIGNLDPFVLK